MVETYIITPDYNGEKFLEKYFISLFNQTYSNFRIIFVDNSPKSNSLDYINQNYYPELKSGKIKIIKNPENYGFAKANNQGIKESFEDSECKFIVCLNNDTEIKEDFLEELILMSKKHPEAGSIQSKIIWGQNTSLIDVVGIEYSINGLAFKRGAYENLDKYENEEEIMGSSPAGCLYKREALEDVEYENTYFDEDFFAYCEDTDLALRLRRAGWNSYYCPKAIMYHYRGGTNEPLSDFTIYHTWRNSTWTIFKNLPKRYIIKKFPILFASELAQISINLVRRKTIILKAKWDAYKEIRYFMNKHKNIKKNVPFSNLEKWFIYKWKP